LADIFISYARADRDKIEKLAAALTSEGYSVWWDRHIEGGASFAKEIEKELTGSKAVIVAWSKTSLESDWVKDEAVTARDQGKLIPISVDGSLAPMGFKQYHAIDFSSDEVAAIADLKRSLATKLGRAETAPETAAPILPPQATNINFTDPKIIGGAVVGLLAIVVLAVLMFRGSDAPDDIASDETLVQATAIEEKNAEPSTPTLDEKSIAVLPFANRSPDPNDAFFAEGMHDELLTRLSKIGDMHVISRTSVMGFADTERKIPEIAHELGVATIMEGAVQRAGDRVRINVQLIDAASDTHLWAETYDRELSAENIFDIQSEITKAIAAALNSILSTADQEALEVLPTQSLAAYDAYIRGRGWLRSSFLTKKEFIEAIRAFDEAIAADKGFAAAYAGKAEAQLSLFWRIETGNMIWRNRAQASIERAQALAPEAVETLVALGYYHYWGFLDYDRANAVIDRALAKAPNNAEVWALKGYVARRAGRFDESINALVKAHSLDPLSDEIPWQLTQSYLEFNRLEEAQAIVDQVRARNPTSERVFTMDARVMLAAGEYESAWTLINETTYGSDWVSYNFFRLITAISMRDPEKIQFALEAFPEDKRVVPGNPETYNMMKAEALAAVGLDEQSRALLGEISNRINASDNAYPIGWSTNAAYFPVRLPGLMRDLAGVRAAVAEFEASPTTDVFGDIARHYSIAKAFERAGDTDAAFEYLDKVTRLVGPSQYLAIKVDPDFDGMRDDPRYLVMKSNYEAWAATQGKKTIGPAQ